MLIGQTKPPRHQRHLSQLPKLDDFYFSHSKCPCNGASSPCSHSPRLAKINESLAKKITARNEYDKTISETENAYMKILESSQVSIYYIYYMLFKSAQPPYQRSRGRTPDGFFRPCEFVKFVSFDELLTPLLSSEFVASSEKRSNHYQIIPQTSDRIERSEKVTEDQKR